MSADHRNSRLPVPSGAGTKDAEPTAAANSDSGAFLKYVHSLFLSSWLSLSVLIKHTFERLVDFFGRCGIDVVPERHVGAVRKIDVDGAVIIHFDFVFHALIFVDSFH